MNNYKFTSRTLIEKGWSGDKKYCVTTEQNKRLLLRVSPIEALERKKTQFELMKRVYALGVPMCAPIALGQSDEGVWSLQDWIEGDDLELVIKDLTENEQYSYGYEAGQILKKIHSIPAPSGIEDWQSYFNKKIDKKLRAYEECELKYEGGELLVEYINSHRELLSKRERTYQHGDYHIGNMMLGKDKRLYIIDFDRDDFGDPWQEFNRIVWCAAASPSFATGMVNGYFDNRVPLEFWKLLALYISVNTISSLPWAIPFGEGEIKTMRAQASKVLEWYDNMKNPIPRWYFVK